MNKKAFSLAELMLVLLIMSIILAMIMPIISKRVKLRPAATTLSGAGQALYLYSQALNVGPLACSTLGAGWLDGGSGGGVFDTMASVAPLPVRTCYNPTKTCQSIYLYSPNGWTAPPACSTLTGGWSDGGYGIYGFHQVNIDGYIRSCYKCN